MELGLGLAVPASGARVDVVVRVPDGCLFADVSTALLERVLPAGATGTLAVDGRPVPPSSVVGEPPLVDGVLLQVDPPLSVPAPVALLELRCTGGPDAGATWPIVAGELVLGRGADAHVRVDDAELSRAHCRLQVPHPPRSPTVEDLASTNGTEVDGAPVAGTPASLALGAVLRAGESSFVLATPAATVVPVTATGDGALAWNRPPRLRPPRIAVNVVVPFPPGEPERSPFPWLLVLAPLVLGVVMWRVLGNATFLLFTLLSPVMVVGGLVTERRTGRRRSRRERALWAAQRDVAETTLARAVHDDERLRRAAWPDPAATVLTALGPQPRLWERRRGDDDALDLRVGLADQPAAVEADGDLRPGSTVARSVPVVVPLRAAGVLGIAGPAEQTQALARWLVLQAAVWHSPRDLQIVVLAEGRASPAWDWTRWLPHLRPDGGQDCRALVGFDATQAAARVAELSQLVEARRTARRAGRTTGPVDERPVLVVVDGARALRAVPGLASLLADGPAVGVHAVAVDRDVQLLPEECGATAVVTGDVGTRLDVDVTGRQRLTGVTADLVDRSRAEQVARALAPLRDDSREAGGTLPAVVRWTDVVDLPLAGSDDDVAQVVARWVDVGRTTEAVLGRGADGVFAVDLRRDGPHALVAGTTGSGKSELLQTLVASLALGNRPDELAFVLVDYKGGAAFGPCARLPHVVGLVTDLDAPLVERALASLGAELTRREAVLAAAGAKDVDDHRRQVGLPGGPVEPLPRLVLVVDEFASLAAELPDFVAGLVGIAMRGRSLGVHLVLATQRPEGAVSADIRANTNLRLCLAVTRESESRDVVDSPAAAAISRTTPGRAYARTGHADLTPFQTGRVGGRRPGRVPHDEEPVVTVLPTGELGDPPPRAAGTNDDDVTDLSLLVDACARATDRLGLAPPRSPWLPPLPAVLVRDDVPPPDDPRAGTPGRVPPLAYGLLDVPAEQARRPLALDLDASTHLLVCGSPRTGRTTALRTLAGAVAAVASPDDVHLYVVDLGGGLGGLAGLPHTGAVVGRDAPERLDRLLTWLAAQVAGRQAQLGGAGHADLAEQRAAAPPGARLPHLLVLLDRWEAFHATYADVDAGRLVDLVVRLLREGPSVGLHVVLTGDRSALVGRIGGLVEERLLLRLADKGDYAGSGVPSRKLPDDLPPGRGFWVRGAALAAQVALLAAEPTGPAQNEALAALGAAVPAPVAGVRPRRIDVLPASVRLGCLPPVGPAATATTVTLAVGGDELAPVVIDIAAHPPGFLVAGPPGSGRSTALLTVAAGLRRRGLRVVAVAPRPSPLRALPGCVTDRDAAAELARLLDATDEPCALLVDDAELLVDSGLAPVLETAVRDGRDRGTAVVVAGTTDELVTGFRGFVVDVRRSRTGVLLSPQSAADGDLLGVRLPRSAGGDVLPGRGLLAVRGAVQRVQVALPDPAEPWTAAGPGPSGHGQRATTEPNSQLTSARNASTPSRP